MPTGNRAKNMSAFNRSGMRETIKLIVNALNPKIVDILGEDECLQITNYCLEILNLQNEIAKVLPDVMEGPRPPIKPPPPSTISIEEFRKHSDEWRAGYEDILWDLPLHK